MDIWIYGKRVRALVDTGSTLTYIGNEIQTLLESRQILSRHHQRTVQLADGTCVSSVKVYPITVNAKGKPTRILASALGTLPGPVILGMDFLRRRNVTLTIDGVKLQSTVAHNRNPLDPSHSMSTREDLTSEQGEKKRERRKRIKGRQQNFFSSSKMERQPTRPLAPGKIKEHLRRTRMPHQVRAYVPPFEARPRVQSVVGSVVAKSGNREIDEIAGKIWEARKRPLHATSSSPPPLVPLTHTPITEQAKEAEPSSSTVRENEAADYLNDILTPDLSEDDDYEDPFRGIVIQPPKSGKRHKWMVYPKGRPKVEVMVRNGIARLRCQGKEKVFSIEHQ